jgi:beta-lactamase superfamily II metal-dependent hydrolase
MLKLRVVQARYGDCLLLESGSGKRCKNILIDGGPGKVYRPHLRGELSRIAAAGGLLDLVVLTHVDNDHVLGLLEFMADLKEGRDQGHPDLIRVRRLWHNAFQQILPQAGKEAAELEEEVMFSVVSSPEGEESSPDFPPLDEAVPFGIGEGVRLQEVETTLQIPRNSGFPTSLVMLDPLRQPVRLGSTKLWVLGPPAKNLDRLRTTWLKWLDQKNGRVSFSPGQDFETAVKPDDSVNNLSSIILLAEAGRRRILLTGDARSSDIISGLEEVGLLAPGGTMRVDILKVPHHGSARNCVGELFDRVLADTYIISADGRHGNPDMQTLNWLVDAACRQGRTVEIFSTNNTDSLRKLVDQRPPEQNNYRLTIMPAGQSSALL